MEVGPGGEGGFGSFDLELLFEGVDAVFTLERGAAEEVGGVDGVGDGLPVGVGEAAAIEVVGPPGVDESFGSVIGPAVGSSSVGEEGFVFVG